eukprot:Nk52_evm9s2284 gene=Nk52_evmTU9s2284
MIINKSPPLHKTKHHTSPPLLVLLLPLLLPSLLLSLSPPPVDANDNVLAYSPSAQSQYQDQPGDFLFNLGTGCVSEEEVTELNWFSSSATYPKIIIETGEWLSSQILGVLCGVLLRDFMNHKNVTVIQRGTDLAPYPHPGNVLTRQTLGQTHFYPETWMQYYGDDPERLQDLVDTSLSIGYRGLEGFYVLPSLLSKFGETTAPEYYRNLRTSTVWSGLEPAGNASVPSVCSKQLCGSIDLYRTSACVADASACRLVLHGFQEWTLGKLENMLENNAFNAELKYPNSYDEMKDIVRDRKRRGVDTMFYSWVPDPFPGEIGAERVFFPRAGSCAVDNDGVNIVPGAKCDLADFDLKKMIWKGLKEYDVGAQLFAEKFTLTLPQINALMATLTGVTDPQQYAETICPWIKSSVAELIKVIPVRPAVIDIAPISVPATAVYNTSASSASTDTTSELHIAVVLLHGGSTKHSATVTVTDLTTTTALSSLTANNLIYANTELDYYTFTDTLVTWPVSAEAPKTIEVKLRSTYRPGRRIEMKLIRIVNATATRETFSLILPPYPSSSSEDNTLIIVAVACGVAFLCILAATIYLYRKVRYIKQLMSIDWVITEDEIEFEKLPARHHKEHQNRGKDGCISTNAFARVSVAHYSASFISNSSDTAQRYSKLSALTGDDELLPSDSESGKDALENATAYDEKKATIKCTYHGRKCKAEVFHSPGFTLSDAVLAEMNRYQMCHHSNIVSLVGATVNPPRLYILTESCERGNVASLYASMGDDFTWTFKQHIIMDILAGMMYLHGTSDVQVHGHLSTVNCLVDRSWTCKISGFGLDAYKRHGTHYSASKVFNGEALGAGTTLALGYLKRRLSTITHGSHNESHPEPEHNSKSTSDETAHKSKGNSVNSHKPGFADTLAHDDQMQGTNLNERIGHLFYWAPEILAKSVAYTNSQLVHDATDSNIQVTSDNDLSGGDTTPYSRKSTGSNTEVARQDSMVRVSFNKKNIYPFEKYLDQMDPFCIDRTQSADVWSFALVLREIVLSQPPHEWISDIFPGLSDDPSLTADSTFAALHEEEPILAAGKLYYDDVVYARGKHLTFSVHGSNALCEMLENENGSRQQATAVVTMLSNALLVNPSKRCSMKELHKILSQSDPSLQHKTMVDQLNEVLQEHTINLEELVEKRTRSLDIEKAKVDQLLSALLPAVIAEQLINNQFVVPETFQEVSIFFSDIVGFTNICGRLQPLEVVDMLNRIYTVFDTITEPYDLYKVETIGDAYMIVSGLPTRNGHLHFNEISAFAIRLMEDLLDFHLVQLPDHKFEIRVGIHSGPVATGVVGTKMPRYCLFGDTVNTASRMESNSLPSRIHISQRTADGLLTYHSELCKSKYDLEERGTITVKGKGEMKTFWLRLKGSTLPKEVDTDQS